MGATINIENTEELRQESQGVLKDAAAIRECIQKLRDNKENLAEWQSAEKEKAIASIDAMIAKLEDLLEMAESYGAVGVQTAAATDAAEEEVRNLNNKFSDYVA